MNVTNLSRRRLWLVVVPMLSAMTVLAGWAYIQISDVIQVQQVQARFSDVRVGDTQQDVRTRLGEPLRVRPAGTGFLWRDQEMWIYGRQYNLLPRHPMLSWRITFRKQRVFGPATGDYCVVFSDDGRVLRTMRIGDRQ